ncbi:MAG: NADH-quinone oxidoreductase subunit C [Lachnospiraceae bacterium]|nr:NADH-quinone oxidoreductase subunit C [Lachnospiraceae bacterium]
MMEHVKEIEIRDLLKEAQKYKDNGWRLVQIFARALKDDAGNEITYSFGDDYEMEHLRITAAPGDAVPSLSKLFVPAFLYENEMHDLFGVKVEDIAIDYHGTFYKLGAETPMKK